MAGPTLTAANIGANTPKIPGPSGGPFGTWDYGTTHTAIIDSRQVYWNANAKSPANQKTGTFVEVYGGSRFSQGHYPSGEPPYFS